MPQGDCGIERDGAAFDFSDILSLQTMAAMGYGEGWATVNES